jgi:iron complex transport system ATP-binding protein
MLLQAENLVAGYGKAMVLQGVGLQLERGDFLSVLGANGSGKSTLLRVLSRNLKPASGTVRLEGKSIFSTDTRSLARRLAFIPQTPYAPGDFTVRELIEYGRYPHLGWTGSLGRRDRTVVQWASEATSVEDLQHRALYTLSGGERQRAFLAMALAQQPEVLLLDEPTTFLDICHQFEVLELIRKLNREFGVGIVTVMHDVNQAARYAQRISVLRGGRVLLSGSPAEVVTVRTLEEAFRIRGRVVTDAENRCPYFIPTGSSRRAVSKEQPEWQTGGNESKGHS